MKTLLLKLLMLMLFMGGGAASAAELLNPWLETEVDGFGDLQNPGAVGGGNYSVIIGNLGGADANGGLDSVDAVAFYYAGGAVTITGLLDPGVNPTPLVFELYSAAPFIPTDPIRPGALLGSAEQGVLQRTLAAGNYILAAYLNLTFDPPFSFSLTGPTTAVPATVTAPQAVPEAPVAALLGLGAAWRLKRRGR